MSTLGALDSGPTIHEACRTASRHLGPLAGISECMEDESFVGLAGNTWVVPKIRVHFGSPKY